MGLAVAAAAVAGVILLSSAGSDSGCDPFSAEDWRAASGRGADYTELEEQARGLIRCGRLQQNTKAEVRDLLGTPEEHRKDLKGVMEWSWIVGVDYLGEQRSFSVRFVGGRVRSTRIAGTG